MKLQRRRIEREANEATIALDRIIKNADGVKRRTEQTANDAKGALAWIVKNVAALEARANSDSYDGFGPGGQSGRRAGVSDPTSAAALRYVVDPDKRFLAEALEKQRQTELAVGQFKDALYEGQRALLRAERIGRSLLPLDPKEARKLAKETPDARTICANPACRADILNLPNDRPREGRCEACYRYRKEHWGNERPRDLCHPEQVEVAG